MHGDVPPFLVVHGSRDETVPFAQAQTMVSALRYNGADVTLHVVDGGHHNLLAGLDEPWGTSPWDELGTQALDFFRRTLDRLARVSCSSTLPAGVRVRCGNGWSHPLWFGHHSRMADFLPALELNAAFYADVVRPLVHSYDHAASLLGWGSDVLGYDTERSTDHGWGLRLQVFVAEPDVDAVRAIVGAGLPVSFQGWPTRFGWEDPEHEGPVDVRHFVDVTTLGTWLTGQLGVDPRPGVDVVDWLVMPQQQLLGVVRGAVYADPHGALANVRKELAYFPDDVWRWMLACQWRRLAQEEHLIGRAAQVGDELGSRVAGVRQVRELMRLAFLLDKAYWPYTKWFGTAFAELPLASTLAPILDCAVVAAGYPEREKALCAAYEFLAGRHNELGVTAPVDPQTRQFFDRPFRVLAADRFAFATRDSVTDPTLRGFPMVGSVDQFADSTDVLSGAGEARRLRAIFGTAE